MNVGEAEEQPRDGAGERAPFRHLRVLDCATLFAGPVTGTLLADFGADVIKIEHPNGDPVRTHGYLKNGVGLWAKIINRNKRTATLNLSQPEGQELLCALVETADVLIENFRPGTLERWGIGPDRLHGVNSRLIILRTTGFGQDGPYAGRPAYGTLAESMSGFAHLTGEPSGPPTLPPFGLADTIAGITGAVAVITALYARDVGGMGGQVIDLAIIEPILFATGPHLTVYDQLGIVQARSGNRSINNAPRNTYLTRDERWVAASSSTTSVAARVMRLVGRAELAEESWFASGAERARHADEIDAAVSSWIGEHDLNDVLTAFEEADAAIAPVYNSADIFGDPQFRARGTIVTVPDEELQDPVKMQNVLFRLSKTPGAVRWAGRRVGEDNGAVYGELGVSAQRLRELCDRGVI